MQSKSPTVPAYLAEVQSEHRADLKQLRALIRQAAPRAIECMRYGLPGYDQGGMLCAFAAQRSYLAFYSLDPQVVESFRPQLGGLRTGKGCIRFRRFADLSVEVIRSMLLEAVRRRETGITSGPCDEPGAAAKHRPNTNRPRGSRKPA